MSNPAATPSVNGTCEDVAQLAPEQLQTICEMVARQCGGTVADVKAHVDHYGFIPLRALHVRSVTSDSLAFL